jgi:predicted nucleic acid-binding protein
MTYKSLFIDSDVLLDLLLKREQFYLYTQILLLETVKSGIQLNTSVLVISNVHYILSKSIGSKASKGKIKELIKTVKVLSFEKDVVDEALDSIFEDFEDAIQNLIAIRYNCQAIITRNIKDYKHSSLPVYTTEQYLNIK